MRWSILQSVIMGTKLVVMGTKLVVMRTVKFVCKLFWAVLKLQFFFIMPMIEFTFM